jgi:hypothetical protein
MSHSDIPDGLMEPWEMDWGARIDALGQESGNDPNEIRPCTHKRAAIGGCRRV